MENIIEVIKRLKEERGAVIMAHNYQRPEVQDAADFVGDSLEMAKESAKCPAGMIVVCGVYFMAETAAIINPTKRIIIPDKRADCRMARMIDAGRIRELKKEYPDAAVVCYVNSTVEVKAECDICCTSSNAGRVVDSLRGCKRIIFVPDRNLGRYLSESSDKEFVFVKGFCPTHELVRPEDIEKVRAEHPQARVLVHPECPRETRILADKVLSTGKMLSYARNSSNEEFIVGTEVEMLYRLRKENPNKRFFGASPRAVCPNMKRNDLGKIREALLDPDGHQVLVDEDIARRARGCIERMLEVG